MRDMTGIERRFDSKGVEQFRPYITDPDDRNRKVRGSWTYSYAEARGWRVRVLRDGPPDRPSKLPKLRDAADAFLEGAKAGTIRSRKRRPYAAKTLRGYEQAFRDWINPELGDFAIHDLDRFAVQRFVDGMAAQRAGGTTRNAFHALAALYSHLIRRHREIGHDPTLGIELPAPAEVRERYAEPEQMLALIEALPHDHAMPFALAFWTGLRKAEIQSLPIDHVDLEGGWIDVRYSLDPKEGFKGPKSGAGERSVPIFKPLRPYLETQVARELARTDGAIRSSTEERPGSLLLPSLSQWGKPSYAKFGTRTFGSKFTDTCIARWRSAGLEPIGLHEGRHSFATALIRAGYDVKLVAEWLGHAQASTTLNLYVKNRGRQSAADLAGKMNTYLLIEASGDELSPEGARYVHRAAP